MAILNSIYQADNRGVNVTLYEITATSDTDITATDIDTFLPNNGSKYNTIDGISFIPTGSSATIYCPNCMVVASFIAQSGIVDSVTNYQTGSWKILAKVAFKTT